MTQHHVASVMSRIGLPGKTAKDAFAKTDAFVNSPAQTILRLMADNRERTVDDVAHGAKLRRDTAALEIERLVAFGRLSVTKLGVGVRVYRVAA